MFRFRRPRRLLFGLFLVSIGIAVVMLQVSISSTRSSSYDVWASSPLFDALVTGGTNKAPPTKRRTRDGRIKPFSQDRRPLHTYREFLEQEGNFEGTPSKKERSLTERTPAKQDIHLLEPKLTERTPAKQEIRVSDAKVAVVSKTPKTGASGNIKMVEFVNSRTPLVPVTPEDKIRLDIDQKVRKNLLLLRGKKPPPPIDASVADPLGPAHTPGTERLPFTPKVQYLGVLLDAGRHYFPIDWIHRLMDLLQRMHYNFLHFRLTDDQTFNIKLDSHPELAHPTSAYGNTQVYTADELRSLVAYAKERGISIMPEINIPGHAGAWAGIPGMIVNCPAFICAKGYGVPLNISNPVFDKVLKNVLREVLDVFDDPPYLHLGGDEVHMSLPCFNEIGAKPFDYAQHERNVAAILKDLDYSLDRVVRWEMTGQGNLDFRAGKITQWWLTRPEETLPSTGPYFISSDMYFDSNKVDDLYNIHNYARRHIHWDDELPIAIIPATFELGTDFWFQRNVVGRLLAVAMGAADLDISTEELGDEYEKYCKLLGFDSVLCSIRAGPAINDSVWRKAWETLWANDWKKSICERLTTSVPMRQQQSQASNRHVSVDTANTIFFQTYGQQHNRPNQTVSLVSTDAVDVDMNLLRKHVVNHTGLILDLVNFHFDGGGRLRNIFEDLRPFGFNLVQLKLVDDKSFAWKPENMTLFAYSVAPASKSAHLQTDQKHRQLAVSVHSRTTRHSRTAGRTMSVSAVHNSEDLRAAVKAAAANGIKVMPEVSVGSNGGGLYLGGLAAECPNVVCNTNKPIPANIEDSGLFPVVSSILRELRSIFTSDFIHLGYDEREESRECLAEAKIPFGAYPIFEKKLSALLKFEGIELGNVLRWENKEKTQYADRAGDVTHYSSHELSPPSGEKFFVTADLFQDSAWGIYSKTRDLVRLNPTGIMADTRFLEDPSFSSYHVEKRVLAYVMAVSELPEMGLEIFRDKFLGICTALGLEGCSTFIDTPGVVGERMVDSHEFREHLCRSRTIQVEKRQARTEVTTTFPANPATVI